MTALTATSPTTGLRSPYNRAADLATRVLGHDLLALVARFGSGGVFFFSGRTKVDGVLTVNDGAIFLFREEYKLPLLPPEFAAHAAACAEHLFPVLLAVGLLTRLSALSLLGMTAVIQVFVYPAAWPTHLSWAAPLLCLIARGGGGLSLDSALKLK